MNGAADRAVTVVIIGGTGDLAKRKLVPALCNLGRKGRLPQTVNVIGFGRSPLDDAAYRELMWDGVRTLGELDISRSEWERFAPCISYVRGDLNDQESYLALGRKVYEIEGGGPADRLFYLSVAPEFHGPAARGLQAAGLTVGDRAWRRVIVEKPFGHDEASARELNRTIRTVFREDQVYRIDHYLGKETVQNLLVLRFANAIFEPVWNRNYIDNVQITVAESVAVGARAAYYDSSGVVRDMVQNHLLQLLCLVAMEPPSSVDADAVRERKADVLRAVRRWSPHEFREHAAAAQYEGYRGEPGVAPSSRTPTYAAMRLYIDNWRWQGTPFYLRSGKALAAKASEIVVQFQRPPLSMFPRSGDLDIAPNLLSICIQPDEGIHLRIDAKTPDAGFVAEPVDLQFHYRDRREATELPEAYERLIEDAIAGDQGLFIRADQTEEAWSIVDPLLRCWEAPDAGALESYPRGSWGPPGADRLLSGDGAAWHSLCGQHP